MRTRSNVTRSPGLPASAMTVIVSPAATLYCLPPVSMTAHKLLPSGSLRLVFHPPPPWGSIFNTASSIAMPLATDFHRGLPPRQDPELKAREHRNRLNGGTSGGEVSPNISKVSSVQLQCATTTLRNNASPRQGCVHCRINDRGPRRVAGSLFRRGVLYKAWRRLSTNPWQRAAADSRTFFKRMVIPEKRLGRRLPQPHAQRNLRELRRI